MIKNVFFHNLRYIHVTNIIAMEKKNKRIVSVDVLRGFDMFWLIGGTGLGLAVVKLFSPGVQEMLLPQFEHCKWQGFHFYDLIFPLFEFVMGMSIVFSLSKIIGSGDRKKAYMRIFRRFLLLWGLGIIYYGGFKHHWPDMRIVGVLPRLAFTYLIASVLFLNIKKWGLVTISAGILIGYWILLSFVPVPGVGHPSVSPDAHWAMYIDQQFLPGAKHDGTWDNCGILGTFPATVSALLGVFASLILINKSITDIKRVHYLIGGGLIMVITGYLWSIQMPIIKKIWTPTYVLVAGGYSFMLMGLFYYLIDIMHFKKWITIFVWIGVNPITIYMARNVMDFNDLARRFTGGDIADLLGKDLGYLALNIVSVGLSLLLLRLLYKHKIFIKV